MTEFLEKLPLFPLVLTFGAFQIGLWCQKKSKSSLCSPILISVALIIGVLLLTGYDVDDYQAGTSGISWLLTPATVCLALPLYQQLKVLKGSLPAILTGVVAGTLTSLVFIALTCRLFGLDKVVSISLLPKSITTAMGLVLSRQGGGLESLTTAAIMITGNLGSIIGVTLCKLLKLDDPIAQGVAFGTASHVIGTSKATEVGQLQGAVGSLSLTVAGILTAVLFPVACMFV